MEISGVVFRPIQSFSGVFFDTHSSKSSFSGRSINAGKWGSGEIRFVGSENSKSLWVLNSGFSDKGSLQYDVSPRGGKKKEIAKEEKEKKVLKKKTKLVKKLWKNLSMYSEMGFLDTIEDDGSIDTKKGKVISKALEILLIQLLQLKAEEKEIKRRQKEEKAKLKKASKMKPPIMDDIVESSSSSCSSSESKCEEMASMSSMRKNSSAAVVLVDVPKAESQEETSTVITNSRVSVGEQKKISEVEDHISRSLLSSEESCCSTSMSSVVMGTSSRDERVDVCMGGKCKKNGAEALLEELKNRVGIEGAVVGCKCMGKCKNGPNVRVVSKSRDTRRSNAAFDEGKLMRLPSVRSSSSSAATSNNSLYIGVGLEDVGYIVDNFMGGEERND